MFQNKRKIEKYRLFWKKENPQPLISFQVGHEYLVKDFEAAKPLLRYKYPITPNMVDIPKFMKDYERLYQDHAKVNKDTFWAATPLPSFPWMGAFMGCEVYSSGDTFWIKNTHISLEEIKNLRFSIYNPWFMKFIDFVKALVKNSKGRYPIGYPIFRGPVEMLSEIRGQSQFVYDLYDSPSQTKEAINNLTKFFIQVVQTWYKLVPPFLGGYSVGIYDLWAPGRCLRLQDDALALLSPSLYQKLSLFRVEEQIARIFPSSYSVIHIHPSFLFLLDYFLSSREINVIEICKDPEPKVKELLSIFKKIQEKKLLMLRGEFTEEEINQILFSLKPQGLYLQIIVASPEKAEKIRASIEANL